MKWYIRQNKKTVFANTVNIFYYSVVIICSAAAFTKLKLISFSDCGLQNHYSQILFEIIFKSAVYFVSFSAAANIESIEYIGYRRLSFSVVTILFFACVYGQEVGP